MSLESSFSVMCRTCLTETTELKSLFILEDVFEEETTSLGNLLVSFTSLQVAAKGLLLWKYFGKCANFRLLRAMACQKIYV